MNIDGINHATLRVRNLKHSGVFYHQVLGLKRVGQRPSMHFYSSGRHAHELALLEDPSYRTSNQGGLMHLCFNAPDEARLRALYKKCQASGFAPSEGIDHTVMYSFYVRDPDGYTIEIGVDRPAEEWQQNPQAFAKDYALDLEDECQIQEE